MEEFIVLWALCSYTNILQKVLAIKPVSIAYCYLLMFVFFYLLSRSFATSRVATKIIQQQKFNVMECTRVIMVTSCAWDSDINKSYVVYALTASAIFYQFSSSEFADFCLYYMSVFLICLCNNISRRRSRQSL